MLTAAAPAAAVAEERRRVVGLAAQHDQRGRRAARTRRAARARPADALTDTSRSSAGTRGRDRARRQPGAMSARCARGAQRTERRRGAGTSTAPRRGRSRVSAATRRAGAPSSRRSCRRSPSSRRRSGSRTHRLRTRPPASAPTPRAPVEPVEVHERQSGARAELARRTSTCPRRRSRSRARSCRTRATLERAIGSRLWTKRRTLVAVPSQTCHDLRDKLDRNGAGGGLPDVSGSTRIRRTREAARATRVAFARR